MSMEISGKGRQETLDRTEPDKEGGGGASKRQRTTLTLALTPSGPTQMASGKALCQAEMDMVCSKLWRDVVSKWVVS